MAEAAPSVQRRQLREMAESWEMLAELEKRHPTAENDNVIELSCHRTIQNESSNNVFPRWCFARQLFFCVLGVLCFDLDQFNEVFFFCVCEPR
jgi:hypothetical protein